MARFNPLQPMLFPTCAASASGCADLAPAPARDAGAVTCWTVPCGAAMTFKARAAGALRVSRGRVWLTFSRPGRIDRYGQVTTLLARAGLADDLMLEAGQSVLLAAGDAVVCEPFADGAAADARLQWRAAAGAR